MKKLLKIVITILGLFFSFQISNVYAEETGPLVVQGIAQEGYKLEVVVLVVKADTEEVVKTLKINPENNWMQETSVPEGEYRIRTYIENLSPRATTKQKATYMVKRVTKNPSKAEIPCFVVMEGDEKFLSAYYGLVDFQRKDGSFLKGNFSEDEMNQYYQEAIGSQTGMLGSSQSSKNDIDKDIKKDSDKNDSIKPKSSKESVNKAGGKESINNIKTNRNKIEFPLFIIVMFSIVFIFLLIIIKRSNIKR
ncbi:hypothetical protein [Streptococcus sp. HMSC074F05]|uniref:hypothetical protein n=1 Tax=Streptococcus sp. HMSC074F05 TaxID=1715164 RepID=UPI0008A57519|nr:hypothetical protein [Streptococcus sp. HMSC074F05]OFN92900.1 hypothetical protein HMPREF2685_06415 [Streptococcus sp. HMSC074F05]